MQVRRQACVSDGRAKQNKTSRKSCYSSLNATWQPIFVFSPTRVVLRGPASEREREEQGGKERDIGWSSLRSRTRSPQGHGTSTDRISDAGAIPCCVLFCFVSAAHTHKHALTYTHVTHRHTRECLADCEIYKLPLATSFLSLRVLRENGWKRSRAKREKRNGIRNDRFPITNGRRAAAEKRPGGSGSAAGWSDRTTLLR